MIFSPSPYLVSSLRQLALPEPSLLQHLSRWYLSFPSGQRLNDLIIPADGDERGEHVGGYFPLQGKTEQGGADSKAHILMSSD